MRGPRARGALAALFVAFTLFGAPSAARAQGAPAADSAAAGTPLHFFGSGEIALVRPDARRQDGRASGRAASVAGLRVVAGVTRRASAALSFTARVAWGASPGAPGTGADSTADAPSLETLALEWTPRASFGLRAGRLRVPVGLESLADDPLEYPGAVRTDVESRILPAPWSALGLVVFGRLAPRLRAQAGVFEGLDAAGFDAVNAVRAGRQDEARARFVHPAVIGRLEADVARGLALGGSVWSGDSWQRAQPSAATLRARVSIGEGHATLKRGALRVRALYTMSALWEHDSLSRALGVAGSNAALGERFFGGYVEAGWNVLPARTDRARELAPFVRWEESDSQDAVGPIGSENPANHWNTLTVGVTWRPARDVAIKAERQQRANETRTQASQWNAGLSLRF